MRKLVVTAVVMALFLGLVNTSAKAIPPFNEAFKKAYLSDPKSALSVAVDKVKCNVCHEGTNKKMKNEYGLAVGKLLKKADFSKDAIDADPAGKAKQLADALAKVEGEKSKDGKTFGEKLKAGALPGA